MGQSDGYAGSFLTSRQACDRLGYSRPDSFIRAWRARGLPLYRRPGGHYLVAGEDLERFVRRMDSRAHPVQRAEHPVRSVARGAVGQ